MRVRTIAVAGSAFTLALVLAACGGGSSATGSGGSSAPVASSATSAPTSPSTVAGGTTSSGSTSHSGGATSANSASFKADLTIQQAGLGLLALTNTGKQTVTVKGWPTLTFLNAANEPVPVTVQKVSVPGVGPSIPIGPGQTAFAGVKWVTGDKGDPKTAVATSISLTPPSGGKAVNVNIIGANGQSGGYIEFDVTSAQVGTLQPSSEGVLVF